MILILVPNRSPHPAEVSVFQLTGQHLCTLLTMNLLTRKHLCSLWINLLARHLTRPYLTSQTTL